MALRTDVKVSYESNGFMVAAHLFHDDGSHALVYAVMPGGLARLADGPTRGRGYDTAITGSPVINSLADLKAFVAERFLTEEV